MAKHNIFISGDIVPFSYWDNGTEFSIKDLKDALDVLEVSEGDELIIDINTFGGDTESGFMMYNLLKRFKSENNISLTTRVTGYCASIGTVILLAGEKRIGNQFNTPFVHNAWTIAIGDNEQMKRVAESLDKTNDKIATIYENETNISKEKALELMKADDFIDADKVLEYGFYTEIENSNANQIFNSINNYKMNINDKVAKIWNKVFAENKNLKLYLADNSEVNFFELDEDADVSVEAKATIDDKPADGTFIGQDNNTYTFENGVLKSIEEPVNDEVQNLKNQLEQLQTENEGLKNDISERDTTIAKYEQFKAEVMNLKVEEPKNDPAPAPKAEKKKEKQTRTLKFY